jgi:hypothetical protein
MHGHLCCQRGAAGWRHAVCVVMVLVCVLLSDFGGNGQDLSPFVPEMGGNDYSAQRNVPFEPDLSFTVVLTVTLCRYLAMKSQLPRKYLRECDHPTCGWDGWNEALQESAQQHKQGNHTDNTSNATSHHQNHNHHKPRKERIVLSYSHNGFGNQLWEHTVAFMVAEGLKARLLIGIIPESLCFDGATPPNTFAVGCCHCCRFVFAFHIYVSTLSFTALLTGNERYGTVIA